MKQVAVRPSDIHFLDTAPPQHDAVGEVLRGLDAPRKSLSPKFFYDERGSRLFEKITTTPEYYPTRTERRILSHHAEAIARRVGRGSVLVEPGAGSCEKVRLLLNALRPRAYVPLDISGDFLREVAIMLRQSFPWLAVTAIRADFTRLEALPDVVPDGRRVVFYPGSTLGNLTSGEAVRFLRQLRQWVGPNGGVLLGIDQHKDTAVLERAYNDAAGHTARFNLNVLEHLNGLLPADFDLARFRHLAYYDERLQRIEMHLESLEDQSVRCADRVIRFRAGERIHTENSHKYTEETFRNLAARGGFRIEEFWQDERDWFRVCYLVAAGRG